MRALLLLMLALSVSGCTYSTYTSSSSVSNATHPVVIYDGTLHLVPGSTAQASVEVPANNTGAALAFSSTGTFAGLTWTLAGCEGSTGGIDTGSGTGTNGRCTAPLKEGSQMFTLSAGRGAGSGDVHTIITVRVRDA